MSSDTYETWRRRESKTPHAADSDGVAANNAEQKQGHAPDALSARSALQHRGCSGVTAGTPRLCPRGHLASYRKYNQRVRLYCPRCHKEAYVPKPRPDAAARFRAKYEPDASGCWRWLGALTTTGYGSFGMGAGKSCLAHRWSYEAHVGPIPAGLTIDHLCRNKRCVNPAHMEPVTVAENNRRAAYGSPWEASHV